MSRLQISIGTVASLFIATFGFWSWYTYQPLKETDYVSIKGQLLRAKEKGTAESPHLDITLKDRQLRFRVGINACKNYFDRKHFGQTAPIGTSLTITVKKEELQSPFMPPKDNVATVFVAALKSDKNVYCTLAQKKSWHDKNSKWALVCSVLGVIMFAYFATRLLGV